MVDSSLVRPSDRARHAGCSLHLSTTNAVVRLESRFNHLPQAGHQNSLKSIEGIGPASSFLHFIANTSAMRKQCVRLSLESLCGTHGHSGGFADAFRTSSQLGI